MKMCSVIVRMNNGSECELEKSIIKAIAKWPWKTAVSYMSGKEHLSPYSVILNPNYFPNWECPFMSYVGDTCKSGVDE